MNRKALYGVMLALLVPLVSFLIFKKKSSQALTMPRHYYPDTVMSSVKNGKRYIDTQWHKLADFSFKNQNGTVITWDSLRGKIVVADLFFTHCPTICPVMTKNMKRLAESIHNGEKVGDRTNKQVHFLSFSIDPERDTVERLKYWADRFQVNPDQWWLLTGSKQSIYSFIRNELKIVAEDGAGVDTNFIHSDRFMLIDSSRHLRGAYSGLDSVSLARLSEDLVLLTMEKTPNEKSFFADKLLIMAIAFLCAIFGVGLFIYFLQKNRA